MNDSRFEDEYKKLNSRQKEAVDTIEGPVLVIAGPGTGKTQVISLRIGNILKQTDTTPDSILCLTFTNSGVEAMRKRLYGYIGTDAGKVTISTFHAFGLRLIEEFYHGLGLPRIPSMLDNESTLALVDSLLNEHEWKHLRPRNNGALYFRDLKSLVSLLIRERMSPERFEEKIRADMKRLASDPESVSSRGATKGLLKKEVQNKIESLEKTLEVVEFYRLYEYAKKEANTMDYDDILSNMVRLATECEDARDSLRERYLYVLVDEHQDSSGIQNEFLKAVWGDVECPNVFAVGDDRQLIYGFSGASLSNFEEFTVTFPGTRVITLTDNYRSTQRILDAAEELLQSSLAHGKLASKRQDDHPIELVECEYPRDEILSAGMFFKDRIAQGTAPEDCALLVPKNSHVRSAATVLRDLGLPVTASGTLRLFDMPEVRTFIHILRAVNDPFASVDVAELVMDPLSGIPALAAHAFLYKMPRQFSVESLLKEGESSGLLAEVNPIYVWGKKLESAVEMKRERSVYELIQEIGKMFFLDTAANHESLTRRVEMIRSLLHLALSLEERGDKMNLNKFIEFLARLEEYGEDIPLAIFGAEAGIRIMTLHASKGLEFDAVWIAHMNERSLMGGKHLGFTLPEAVRERIEEKDEAAAKREVYVAITRAKRYSVLSYARMNHKGAEERLAGIIESLPQELFVRRSGAQSESSLLEAGAETYVAHAKPEIKTTRAQLVELVTEKYTQKKVSVTLLNSFYECPWKWYFLSFLEVPEPVSESLEFGSVVHGAIEEISGLGKIPAAADIDQAIARAIEGCHIAGGDRTARMVREARVAVTRFAETLLPSLFSRRESEKPLSRKEPLVPDLVINGKIDLVEYASDTSLRVTDFKTGKTRSSSDIQRLDDEGRMSTYMRQLAMYSYLLESAHKGEARVDASRLYFVEEDDQKKACFETKVEPQHVELLLRDIKDYDEFMKSGKWIERACSYKPHRGESTCPYCQRAMLYQ